MNSKTIHCIKCENAVEPNGFFERMEGGLCRNCLENLSPDELKREKIKAAYEEMEKMGSSLGKHYGFDGKEIPGWEWAWMMETRQTHLHQTHIWPHIYVSTVLLGIDYGFGLGGRPIIFETMVSSPWEEHEQERYCTMEEATAGHLRHVNRWWWLSWILAPKYIFLIMAKAILKLRKK